MATWHDLYNNQHPFSPSPKTAMIAYKTLNLNDLHIELKSVMGAVLIQQQDSKVQSEATAPPAASRRQLTRLPKTAPLPSAARASHRGGTD